MKKHVSITNRIAQRVGLRDFETIDSVTARQKAMLRLFEARGIKHDLGECGPTECSSPPCVEACHFATFRRRIAAVETGLPFLQRHCGPHYHVCIVHPLWEADEAELSTIGMAAAKQWAYRRLWQTKRGVWAIGIFEASLNVELSNDRYWAGELQFISCGLERDELKKALKIEPRYREMRPRQRMVQISEVVNLERQFMYAQKRFVEQRVAYLSTNGRQHRRHLPLNSANQLEFDCWLNELPSGSRNVCFGLSRRGHTFYGPDAFLLGGGDEV